jgi:hypothetical protein
MPASRLSRPAGLPVRLSKAGRNIRPASRSKSMWSGPEIKIGDWDEFIPRLRAELGRMGIRRCVLVRNFDLWTCDIGPDDEMGEMVDRLDIVHSTGTDRDASSDFWNAEGHDWDHELRPAGRAPNEIIYAYPLDVFREEPVVILEGVPTQFDITAALDEQHGILIYDPLKLDQVSKNEHWFKDDPIDALLMIFTLAGDEDGDDDASED